MFAAKSRTLNILLKQDHVLRSFCNQPAKNPLEISSGVSFGQPTHYTHPDLIQVDEITPLVKKEEYQKRRSKLINSICSYMSEKNPQTKRHLIVIPSATKQYMSDKIPYWFRQNSDFFYLTGCLEPDSCLVINAMQESAPVCTLFMQEKDEHSELWDGPRTGPGNTPFLFGVEQSLPARELEQFLQSYKKTQKSSCIWYDFMNPIQSSVHRPMCEYLKATPTKQWDSPKSHLHQQRIIKSSSEISLMRKSCEIASEAIINTIQFSKPGIKEHDIFAKVDYECRIKGAQFLAYPPVVAGGPRANIIHYINNNQVVKNGEMVLMDAGCEYFGYSSDITRTWPINGRFSARQKEVYDVVLYVQKELIKLCGNGRTLDSLFDVMCSLLGKGLQEVGVLPRSLSQRELLKEAYGVCPHHVSHYLGMDVHDTPLINRNIPLQPGMIVTVEPGVYLSHKNKQIPKEFHGIGIRIEDDILITQNQPLVLTQKCPKEIDEIEEIACQNQ